MRNRYVNISLVTLVMLSHCLHMVENVQGSQLPQVTKDKDVDVSRGGLTRHDLNAKQQRKFLKQRETSLTGGLSLKTKGSLNDITQHGGVIGTEQLSVQTSKDPRDNVFHRHERSATQPEDTNGNAVFTKPDNAMLRSIVQKYDRCYKEGLADTCDTSIQCSCEDNCRLLDNCCVDAAPTSNATLVSILASFEGRTECVNTGTDHFKMVTSCAPELLINGSEDGCSIFNRTSVLHLTPVYDSSLKLSYRNIFCAMCNGANSNNLQFWEINLRSCRYFEMSEMNSLTQHINRLLSEPNTTCRLYTTPRNKFSTEECLGRYVDGYQCDGHVPMGGEITGTTLNTRNLDEVTFPTVNLSSDSTDATHSSPNNIGHSINTSMLRDACHSYKSLIQGRNNRGIFWYRNIICVWCKVSDEACMADIKIPRKRKLSFSLLINFHSAFDVISKDKNTDCEENEVMDTLNNVCRRLICTGRRVASYGNCIDSFEFMTTWFFSLMLFAPCNPKFDPKRNRPSQNMLQDLIQFGLLPFLQVRANTWHNMRKVFASKTQHDYCFYYCLTVYTRSEMSRTDALKIIDLLDNVFALGMNGSKYDLTRLDMKNNFTNCSRPIQADTSSLMTCPYITLNITEFALLEVIMENNSVILSPDKFVNTNDTYSVCFPEYKRILNCLDDDYPEKNHESKSILSITLVCISLFALIISIIIYVIHPQFNTIPCYISLCIMITLGITCILFILSYILVTDPTACYVLAILTHCSWLCVFLWSVISGYHSVVVFSTLPIQRGPNLNARKKPRSIRLYVYGAIAFIIPIVVTGTIAILDHTHILDMDYGVPTCFINNKQSLFYAFGIPTMTMCLLNIVFLATSIVKLYRFSPGGSSCNQMRTNVLEIAVKLFFCSGLTWVFGILAAITNVEVLWYLHIVCNSSHGIFLFLVLIACSTQVRTWVKCKCNSQKSN